MKICICGGGNIAHAFLGELGHNTNNDLYVLTRQPNLWKQEVDVYKEDKYIYSSKIIQATSDSSILSQMDIVIISLPGHIRNNYITNIKPYINSKTILISAPSTGGVNFIFKEYFPQNKFICMQRVPYISRIREYGKSVNINIKKAIEVYFSEKCTDEDYKILKDILKMDIISLKSIWPLVLSNSNPILHIAGMLEILHSKYPCDNYSNFYEQWSDYASQITLAMDEELEAIMNTLEVNEFHNLKDYYEIKSSNELTLKLKSIQAFKTVKSPLINVQGQFVIDNKSRYLVEDLPFGTCVIKYVAEILNIPTPNIDNAIQRLQDLINKKYINNNRLNFKLLDNDIKFLLLCRKELENYKKL